MVDLAPVFVGPTWRNGRSGAECISKRLDRFLAYELLVHIFSRYRTCTLPLVILDQFLVCLEWDEPVYKRNYPFKLNRASLLVKDFSLLVNSSRSFELSLFDCDDMTNLVLKLKILKGEIKHSEKRQKLKQG